MRRILVGLALVMLISFLTSGCRSSEIYEKSFTYEDFMNNSGQTWDISDVRDGDIIKATLYANPTTGYVWRISGYGDDGVFEKDGSPLYEPPANGLMGAGGTETWIFKVVKPGQGSVLLEYVREWEESPQPEWTLQINVDGK